MEKEKKLWDKIYCAMVAIFAVLYDPKKLRENPGNALRSADSLIQRVPKFLAARPPWEEPLDEASKGHWAKQGEEIEEAEKWGFLENRTEAPPEKIFSFDEAVRQPWCGRFKTENGLGKFLERAGYSKKYLESRQITEVGYNRALENDSERKRRLDQTRKRNRRKDSERKKA
jgi:hypothetical protein